MKIWHPGIRHGVKAAWRKRKAQCEKRLGNGGNSEKLAGKASK